MQIVPVGSCAVETDLQNNSIAWQRPQTFRASSGKQHSIGQHCCRSSAGAGKQNLVDIFQQKRLAPGNKDLLHTKLRRFTSNPLYTSKPQFATRHIGRGTHAAVVAAQITVEICVEPKARANWPVVFSMKRSSAVTEYPPHPAFFNSSFEKCVSSEPAPPFQFWSNARFVADYGNEIARLAAVQRSDQLRQQAGRERLSANVQFDVSLHCHMFTARLSSFLIL